MRTKTLIRTAMSLVALFLVLGQRSAFADEILNINVNTSGLGSPANSEIYFILTGTGANTVTLSNISLGGGSAGAVDLLATTGGTSPTNSLTSGISLNDTADFLTVFAQPFSAGSSLSFLLDLTTNVVSPNPDQFSIEIVDPNGNLIPTSDPTGFDNLLAINLDSANPTTNIYSNLVSAAPVPEPSSLLLFASGFVGLGFWRRRAKHRNAT